MKRWGILGTTSDRTTLDGLARTLNVSVAWLKAAMKSDAEEGRDMAKLSNAERLARAVLMFFDPSEWTREKREQWLALTGTDSCTSMVLGNLARQVRDEEERK